MSLITNLISYWKLDESSGSALDGQGANDLTDHNSVGTAAGVIGTARSLASASSQYLSHADNADLSIDGSSFTFTCWRYVSAYDIGMAAGKWIDGIDGEWKLGETGTSPYYIFKTFDGSSVSTVSSTTYGFPPLNAWHFVAVWYDATAGTINLQVNDGTVETVFSAASPHPTAIAFTIGGESTTLYIDGRIDEIGFWKRVLTSQERTDLYNGGAGLSFSSFGGGPPDIVSFPGALGDSYLPVSYSFGS